MLHDIRLIKLLALNVKLLINADGATVTDYEGQCEADPLGGSV